MNTKSTLQDSTPEFIKTLYQENGRYIKVVSPLLTLEFLLVKELSKREKNVEETIVESLYFLSFFANYINIELSSISRANFRANSDAEKRYNLKYINCVILEAYKYLYGYKSKRKKSLWLTKIAPLLKCISEDEFRNDYNILEKAIQQFGDSNITSQYNRNLSLHYDLEPIDVYNHLMGIHEEDEYQRLKHFNELIHSILIFSTKYAHRYIGQINFISNIDLKDNNSLVDLNIFCENEEYLFNVLQDAIVSYDQKLQVFAVHQNIPKKFREIFNEGFSATINTLIELEKTAIQLSYIYIDLAAAICAFLTSEYTLEKLFALKQINIIAYEGFNKLYSLDDNFSASFWQLHVQTFISSGVEASIYVDYNRLTQMLIESKEDFLAFENQRNMSVHYDRGIFEIYDMLLDLNPLIELSKGQKLLELLPQIFNFLGRCLNVIEEREKIENNKAIEKRNNTLDKLIGLLSKKTDNLIAAEFIKELEKIRTGEFFNNLMENRSKD